MAGYNWGVRVAQPPGRALMIYDGDCRFCRQWITRWQGQIGQSVDFQPFQDPTITDAFPELSRAALEQAVHLVEPDGTVRTGAAAVFHALHHGRRRSFGWFLYRRVPGLAAVCETAYRFVARHRPRFSFVSRLLWGTHAEAPRYQLTRAVFLRGLGLIYLMAILSFWTQLPGLIGSRGILPAAETMELLRTQSVPENGWMAYWLSPTVCWLDSTDTLLHTLCAAGIVLAGLVVAGIAFGPALLGLWTIYLSLSTVAGVFLGYQWDTLLVEIGLLATLFAPWRRRRTPAQDPAPSPLLLFMGRWLLFRLMFSSGATKLASGDELWSRLAALQVHFETQPLPTVLGWYAHQLPAAVLTFCCGAMFVIELGLPFLVFLPRGPRCVAATGFCFLMLLIALTGNYCFFNLLTALLCVLLLDDAVLSGWLRRLRLARWLPAETPASAPPARGVSRRAGQVMAWAYAAVVLLATVPHQTQLCGLPISWPGFVSRAEAATIQTVQPLRSINRYGLFAVMTPERKEILLEGSQDGVTWHPYRFRYQPGDPARRPRWAAPHQPRIDWQMWFEALRPPGRPHPWFMRFCARLLEGEPAVLRLLETNPFPDGPPRYLRATLREYRFTDAATRATSGNWWQISGGEPYLPVLSLRTAAHDAGPVRFQFARHVAAPRQAAF